MQHDVITCGIEGTDDVFPRCGMNCSSDACLGFGAAGTPPRHRRTIQWLLVSLAGLLLGVLCWQVWPTNRSGDGGEYLAMSVAFVRHGSPDIRPNDVEEILKRNYGLGSDGATDASANAWLQAMRQGSGAYGLYRARNSRFYSYHFWLYSLINAPALLICLHADAPLYSSFLITNAILLWGLVALITFVPLWPLRRKLILLVLVAGCGSTFYLPWTGPEPMCFVLLIAGLLLLEARYDGWALFAFAAAAQQNPPIGLLAVVAGAAGCLRTWRQLAQSNFRAGGLLRLLRFVPGGLILIASPVFYLIEFGTPSMIIKAGGARDSLISSGRLASLFFDLNQGMVIAMPLVFLVLAGLIIFGLWKRQREVWYVMGLVICVILMTVPALSTTNWNAGETIIMRYAYWLSAPLLYSCAFLMEAMLGRIAFSVTSGALLASQSALLAWLGVFGTTYFYVSESPLATWVFDNHPSWYAPIPEIFVERGTHIDGGLRSGRSYFYVSGGYLRVLLSQNSKPFALNVVCSSSNYHLKKHMSELSWSYWYPADTCPTKIQSGFYSLDDDPKVLQVGTNMMTADSGNVDSGLPGFKPPENWGVWSNQKYATFPLVLPANVSGRPVREWSVTLEFHPFVLPSASIPLQHVVLFSNGTEVMDMRLKSPATVRRTFVTTSKAWAAGKSIALLEFKIPTARSYKELGLSQDPNELGVGLESISVAPAGE